MEINKTIAYVFTITLEQSEVFKRVTDESLMVSYQRAEKNIKGDGNVITDDDRAFFERYYRSALAELCYLLARRTTRVGGSITNTTDEDTGYITTVFTLPMTMNNESELLQPLASHCLDFMVDRVLEIWYGHGADFGSNLVKDQIRSVLHYRRFPIERPGRVL